MASSERPSSPPDSNDESEERASSAAGAVSPPPDEKSPPKTEAAKKSASGKRPGAGAQRGTGKSAGRRKKTGKKRREPEEYEPIFSGRLVLATAICLAMVLIPLSPLGRIIAKESPESQAREAWRVGTEGTVHVTLITADFEKLACADERELEGMHCSYKDDKEPFPNSPGAPYDDNKKNIIQPYRTTDGQLLFMAGLWAQPEISMRLHNEPGHNVAEKKLARFVAECRVKFLAEWQGTRFRWAPRDSWSSGETGMVARPISCRIFQGEER